MSNDELPAVEARRQWIIQRRLEITAALAEWKRQYFAEGVQRPFVDRCTLKAEDAALAVELGSIKGACIAAKAERARRVHSNTLAQLKALLIEEGRQDLIALAEARAMAEDAA